MWTLSFSTAVMQQCNIGEAAKSEHLQELGGSVAADAGLSAPVAPAVPNRHLPLPVIGFAAPLLWLSSRSAPRGKLL